MKRLRFIVKGKERTSFADTSITFLRGVQTSKIHSVPYTNGNGFQIAGGAVLLTEGVVNQVDYLNISANGTQTITGTGNLSLLITKYPNSTQASQSKQLTVDGSTFNINLLYNSRPIITDMEIEVDNRTDRVVTLADFIPYVSDFDGDSIGSVTIFNADNNLEYNGSVYINGTEIPAIDIANGLLIYKPDDTDIQYNDDYEYRVTDSQGNSSD